VLIVIVIPGYFYSEIMKEERDIGGVNTSNREIFKKMISEDMHGAKIPVLLGQGEEFSSMKVGSKQELELMKKIRNNQKIKEAIPETGPDERAIQIKPVCLLMGYIYGLLTEDELNNPKLVEDIFTIMRTMPSYITIIIQECMTLISMLRQRKTYKRISASNILGVIQFS